MLFLYFTLLDRIFPSYQRKLFWLQMTSVTWRLYHLICPEAGLFWGRVIWGLITRNRFLVSPRRSAMPASSWPPRVYGGRKWGLRDDSGGISQDSWPAPASPGCSRAGSSPPNMKKGLHAGQWKLMWNSGKENKIMSVRAQHGAWLIGGELYFIALRRRRRKGRSSC